LPDLEVPIEEEFEKGLTARICCRSGASKPLDVSNTLLFLESDDARYIRVVQLPVDAGSQIEP
jgi:hypothetical protein